MKTKQERLEEIAALEAAEGPLYAKYQEQEKIASNLRTEWSNVFTAIRKAKERDEWLTEMEEESRKAVAAQVALGVSSVLQ